MKEIEEMTNEELIQELVDWHIKDDLAHCDRAKLMANVYQKRADEDEGEQRTGVEK